MRTFTTREEVVHFLLEEDKPCHFARAAINFIGKEWPDNPSPSGGLLYGFRKEDHPVPKAYSEIEILIAYHAVSAIMSFDGQTIYIDGIPLYDAGGWPLKNITSK